MATFSEPCPTGTSLGELLKWRFRRDKAVLAEQQTTEEHTQPIPITEKHHDKEKVTQAECRSDLA